MRLLEVFEKPGGYAMKNAGVTRIEKKYISATIQHISDLTGIPRKDLHPLGSTGKTKSSGDIDLGVDKTKYDLIDIHSRLCNKLGEQSCSFNEQLRVASYAVPIMRKGKNGLIPTGDKVQVDLMFVPNLKWAQFSYHSEGTSGKPTAYKGAIRNILLKAIAATYEEEGVDKLIYDPKDKDLIIRIGRTFDLNRGLRRIFQVRPQRKYVQPGQSPFLQGLKTVHSSGDIVPILNMLKKQYPDQFDSVTFDADDREIVIDDPDDFLKIMFPGKPKVTQNDVKTTEDIVRLIKSRFDPDRQRAIIKRVYNATKYLQSKMRVPDWKEMFAHLNKNSQDLNNSDK